MATGNLIHLNDFLKYYFLIFYSWADHAPHIFSVKNMGFYLCGHHVLKAHAKAYYMYKGKYFPEQQGEVGINVNSGFNFKLYPNVTDEVIDRSMQFYVS